jgi:Flp pilus assembly secretin CpaC
MKSSASMKSSSSMKIPAMKIRGVDIVLLAGLAFCASALRAETPGALQNIVVGAGKTHLIDTATNIERVSVASPGVAEAAHVNDQRESAR